MMGKGFLQSGTAFRHRLSLIVVVGALLAGTSLGASVMVGTGTAAAATTTVDCSTTNLQTAIDNAASGDTLVVSGTCAGNFTIENKDLTLLGSGHAVLDAQHNGTALSVPFVEPITVLPVVTVANFSIINGTSSGISAGAFTTLTLKDDVVTGNSASGPGFFGVGGGVDAETTATLIVDNTVITHNSAAVNGGGIGTPFERISSRGSLTVNDSTISGNSAAPGLGGGIGEQEGGPPLALHNTTVRGNSGGGINALGSFGPVTLDQSAVIGNTGGAGLLGAASLGMTLQESRVIGNTSSGDGGGIASLEGSGPLELDNSAVIGNTAAGNGGGIFLAGTAATLNNSVVAGNTAGGNGGGIFLAPQTFVGEPGVSATLDNTKVNGNNPNNCYPLGSVTGCTG
jgi:hypothetical protein